MFRRKRRWPPGAHEPCSVPCGDRSQGSRLSYLLLGWSALAEAHITRIVIIRVESPTFEGTSFGTSGRYEKLVGRAFGEVDPGDPRNAADCRYRSGAAERPGPGGVFDGHLHPSSRRPLEGKRQALLRDQQPRQQFLLRSAERYRGGAERSDQRRRCREWLPHAPGLYHRSERLGRRRRARRRSSDDRGADREEPGWLSDRRPCARRVRHRQ